MDGEKETIIMGAAEVICCFFLEEKIYTTDQKLVNTSTHAYLRYDRLGWAKCDGMAHSQVGWGG